MNGSCLTMIGSDCVVDDDSDVVGIGRCGYEGMVLWLEGRKRKELKEQKYKRNKKKRKEKKIKG